MEDVLEQTEPLSTIESTQTILTLADVMQFLTGSRFKTISSVKGQIHFNHVQCKEGSQKRSEANTCACEVTTPVSDRYLSSIKSFTEHFTDDIFEGQGFGKV